jgi:hypothetical protein
MEQQLRLSDLHAVLGNLPEGDRNYATGVMATVRLQGFATEKQSACLRRTFRVVCARSHADRQRADEKLAVSRTKK